MAQLRILAIGAHPDDGEFKIGGMASLWANRGDRVCLMSVTNGQSGHHRDGGHALVERRMREAAAAAAVIQAESRVLPLPDGHLEPTLANRLLLIREIRSFSPDVILTNRPNDYHPDHRYTAQLVQDAAFSLTVPHIAPDSPALASNPLILYWHDAFQRPIPFQPSVVLGIDRAFETKLQMLHQHTSQMYEWLPWLDGDLERVPADETGRMDYLRTWYQRHANPVAQMFREKLVARYGPAAAQIVHAEAFEPCEYGAAWTEAWEERIFGGI